MTLAQIYASTYWALLNMAQPELKAKVERAAKEPDYKDREVDAFIREVATKAETLHSRREAEAAKSDKKVLKSS